MLGTAEFEKTEEEEIEDDLRDIDRILSADQIEQLLYGAERYDPEIVPYIAIPAFTGLRRATLEKLDWRDIQLSNKKMYISRYKGKKRKSYPVPLTDNLIEWLTPFEQESGSLLVPSGSSRNFGGPSKMGARNRLRKVAHIVEIPLADNTFRHTAISMDIAVHGNIHVTATKTNTSVQMIQEHYLGKVKNREDAVRYFEIRPHLDLASRLRIGTIPVQYFVKLNGPLFERADA
jgi:integrase